MHGNHYLHHTSRRKVNDMDKVKLNQYRSLQKEVPLLKKRLDRLYERREKIPVVKGKVKASSRHFPYIERHMSVQMAEPKEADKINKQIQIIEERLKQAEDDLLEIENFIADIQDSTDRLIFEFVYKEGRTLEDVGAVVGYSKGRVSQKISKVLKD